MRPRTIRGQLARILVVSLVLVLGLLGVTVAREVKAFRESGDTVHAVSLALAVQDLVQQAQRERGLSNGLLGGDIRLVQTVADQRADTDRAMRALEEAAAGNTPGATQVRSALGQFDALDATRAQVDARRTSRQAAFQFYTDGISALNRLTLGLDQARDAEVRHGLQALYALGEAKEQTAKERGFLNGVFAADEFRNGEYVEFLDIRAAKMAGLTAFARDATAAQQAQLDTALRSENAVKAGESERIAIASSAGPLVRSVDSSTWWAQMTAVIDEQRTVQQGVGDDVQRRAQALRRDAFLTLGGFLLAALIAIAAEVVLVFASVRAIVRPLAELAAAADDVANHRLPEVIAAWQASDDTHPDPPAPVRTPRGASAEIAAVAGALDGVQTTAFELASQQALVRRNTTESMANLARRNQNLVRRQLGLISEFEREELDPKALSNLFELDHLATRMRRNAESLLVLVGSASPRRWAEPIALTDVIRAGLSEVDDYRRVVLRRVDDIAITGAVVSDLAHMLAELIENGLAFSPPDMEVEIYGRKLPTGYLLAVVDHGVGMPVDQLAEANARLRGETDFIVASTRYLGHYVVGRLARRLGIDVELNVSPVSGIVARLLLPAGIIAGEKDRRAPAAGQRGEAAAGPAGGVPGARGHTGSAVAGFVGSSVVSRAGVDDRRAPAGGERGEAAAGPAGGVPGARDHTGSAVAGFVGSSVVSRAGEDDRRAPAGGEQGEAAAGPAGGVPGVQRHTESAAEFVGASGGSLAGEPISAIRPLGRPRHGAPVNGARVDGAQIDSAWVNSAWVDGAGANGSRVDGAGSDKARVDGAGSDKARVDGAGRDGARVDGAEGDGARVERAGVNGAWVDGAGANGSQVDGAEGDGAWLDGARANGSQVDGASLPGGPTHDVQMTGGSDLDGVEPRRARSGGPAHSRPGFASPTSTPALFAHFHSTPGDSGDGVGFTAADVEGAVPRGDRAASEGISRGDQATSEGVSRGDQAASGGVSRGDQAASGGPRSGDWAAAGVIPTGDTAVAGSNGSLTGLPRVDGTGSDDANGSQTGLPVNGSGTDRSANAVPTPDRQTDAVPTTERPRPAVHSSTSHLLWQIPETATAATESDATPAAVPRTKNGLVKRNKRARSTTNGSGSAPTALTPAPPSAPVVERSPAEIRSMLASFRAGHERGTPTSPRMEASENIPRATDLAQTSALPTTAEELR
ncbi:nitrate- and nitrite sensing domain-containing protein [Nocardia sp. NPDC050408]|uniref:nitrate- and nitrite sensing domain-containing protein n=1 Tax=Nocardia sp. NPDC050408 TaxID=3364319 RepID=UPI0037B6306B